MHQRVEDHRCTAEYHAGIKADPEWGRRTRRRAIWVVKSRWRPARALDLRDCLACGSTLSRQTAAPGLLRRVAYALLRLAEQLLKPPPRVGPRICGDLLRLGSDR